VDCQFCHAQGDFASDEKRAKTTARHMIEMTQNINKTSFNGNMRVRCFTCHQGHEEPVNVPE
jgi:photosynthetic reaction center cytochrome c subunit